ncbi:MAG: hypothetical protein PVG66_02200, partial [Chromatiales bacterium]
LYQESAFAGEFLAHIWLARLLQKHGYKEDAVEWYRNALKIDGVSDCEELAEAREYVDNNHA